MRELDVRKVLNKEIIGMFHDDPETLIINEFGVCQGKAIVDVAVINGNIHGFEIKSASDNLERLPSQLELYNKVLETMTIVSSENHIEQVEQIVPKWWGILKANQNKDGIYIEQIRKRGLNPGIDPYSLAQLLWHDEALEILEENEMADGIRSKPRRYIWLALANNIPLPELSQIVRDKLKQRDSLKKRDNSLVVLQQK